MKKKNSFFICLPILIITIIIGIMTIYYFIYGTKTILEGSDGYRQFSKENIHSPLVVFHSKEIERLNSEQLSYLEQTNTLYLDKDNFRDYAYVALANWLDRYEYAYVMEDERTIIYVYLENMDIADCHMNTDYLPLYFQESDENNSSTQCMSAECRSYYAFALGKSYIECMDLVE